MKDNAAFNDLSGPICTDSSMERAVFWFFWGSFGLFLLFYAIRPIGSPDFWWHLKSGELMVQSGGLLQSDKFTYSGRGVISSRETLILQGYWIWQLAAYSLYSLLGVSGVFLLNFLTVAGMAGVVAQQMRRQQVESCLAIFLLTLGFFLIRAHYTLERPQVISFLFAAILVSLLTRVRDGGRLGWALPLLMTGWANLHGGFIVGDIILLCFAGGAIIEYRHDLPRLRHLLGWIAMGLCASLINPTGALAFLEILSFQGSELMTGVVEYQSTWTSFLQGSRSLIVLWFLILLYVVGFWRSRRLYLPELGVALFLALFSCGYLRNVGFFAVAMLPSIAFHWQQGTTFSSRGFSPLLKTLIFVLCSTTLLWQAKLDWQGRKDGAISSFYPKEAVEFIQNSGLRGRMYNDYDIGGYLLWKLYPQHQVFIDGRGLDPAVFNDARAIKSASLKDIDGRKEYEVLLEKYGIDYVFEPLVFRDTGRLTPLMKFLLVKQEWIPVYVDSQRYILVRNSQLNRDVIAQYGIDKREFSDRILSYLAARRANHPAGVYSYIGLTEMLIYVGRYAEAEKYLQEIMRLQPDNPQLPGLRSQLDVLSKGRRS